ncbi:head protein [Mycobacteroides sp. H001]|uniref:phage major capsid protein n=1 Tax=unclassified Mycobacteroides TaxID=2618759 RepID=UPI000713EC90|nr:MULTISPECIES: phage major capsid protein [unclassified Mycobacteroides]KRQ29791.1 head protein [Mycobacteroides sp. H002]KRQ29879.1 head protein [Mycobacteroides sp. H072]KRQ48339.1 head protein [Mycobacteroides sp. H054]KRQ65160.1 head protein [Mycobacteroides sp. H001]
MTTLQEKLEQLQKDGNGFLAKAREIAEKHGQGGQSEWPETDVTEYSDLMGKATQVLDQIKVAKADIAVIDQAKALGEQIGNPIETSDGGDYKAKASNLGLAVVGSPEFKAMLHPFTHNGQISIPKGSHLSSAPIAVKSLITGSSSTSGGAFVVNERTDIVEMLGRKELKIRDLISTRRTGSDTVEFVRQTSHTNAADVVPEATSSARPTAPGSAGPTVNVAGGGYKPEGSWAFEIVSTTVKTIAEWVPITKRALADVAQLEGLINDELSKDVAEKEEDQILNGSGSGENIAGINNTSGIQAQAWTTDFFTTTRKAVTKARHVGRANPNAWVFNPADAEALDLLKDGENRYYYGGPQSITNRTLWGIPVVESESQPEGNGLLGDYKKAVLWDREQTTVTMTDSHEDFFVRNLVAVLGEERVAFGVTRPPAFVSVDLTA